MEITKRANEYTVTGVPGVYRYDNAYNFSRLYFYPNSPDSRPELIKKIGIPGVLERGASDPDPDFRAAIQRHSAELSN